MQRNIWLAEDWGRSLAWFDGHLSGRNIYIKDSTLRYALKCLSEIRNLGLGTVLSSKSFEEQQLFVNAAVHADTLTKAVHWASTRGLEIPRKRLNGLAKTPSLFTCASPAWKVDKEREARDKAWETFSACLAATFATDVILDVEPDIQFAHGGSRWGVAAKVSHKVGGLENQVRKGIEQCIKNRVIDAGFVFVNAASVFPQEYPRNILADEETFKQRVVDWVNEHIRCDHLNLWASKEASLRGLRGLEIMIAVPQFIDDTQGRDLRKPNWYCHWVLSHPHTQLGRCFFDAFNQVNTWAANPQSSVIGV